MTFLSEVTCFWGMRGSGKTTLARKLIQKARPKQLLILDPHAQGEFVTNSTDVFHQLKAGKAVVQLRTSMADEQLASIYYANGLSRHDGFGMAVIGQRPAVVDATIRSQAASTYWLKLVDHVDVSTAQKSIGPDRAAQLGTFQPGQFIQWPEAPQTKAKPRKAKDD